MSLVYRFFKQLHPNGLVLFANLIIYLPLAILQRPIWDGALSNYARKESYRYLNLEAIDYSFPTQYFHEVLINYISLKTHVNFYIYYWLLVCIVLSLIYKSLQILTFSLDLNSLDSIQSNKRSAIIFAFFPAFHVLYSTQNFIWIICLASCLWGTIFLFSNNYRLKIIGALFILFSFQMASLPFLFLILFSALFRNRGKLEIIKVFFGTAFFCTLFLSIFRRFLFHPAGIYKSYNSVNLDFKTLPIIVQNFFNFIMFIVPILILYAFIATYGMSKIKFFLIFRLNKQIITWLFFILLSCVFPYVLALKSPSRLDLFDWSYRHGIITIVPLLLFFFWVSDRNEKKLIKFSLLNPIAAMLVLVLVTVTATFGHVQSMVFDKGLIYGLSSTRESWEDSDLLCFEFENRRINYPRFYELNEVIWQAISKTKIQSDSSKNCSASAIKNMNYFSNPSVSEISESKWKNIYIGGINSESKKKLVVRGSVGLMEIYHGIIFSNYDFLNITFSELDFNAS